MLYYLISGDIIMMYNLRTGKTQPLIPILEGNGFYAWAPFCALIMGVGPKLFEFKPGKDKDWQLIGNLSAQGIKNISRLAIDPEAQWLAIINSPLAN